MAEYIDREVALKIVTDMMCDCKVTHKGRAIRRNIKQIPIADVVEVVRCKNCEKWDTSNKLLNTCACTRWSQSMPYPRLTSPDDFCSYGERKEGAEE